MVAATLQLQAAAAAERAADCTLKRRPSRHCWRAGSTGPSGGPARTSTKWQVQCRHGDSECALGGQHSVPEGGCR
eukprot:14843813-Alexandrium_andersonii.AAC.1